MSPLHAWLELLAPCTAHLGINSLKAIPLILLLVLLQRFALRRLSPRGMMLLWFLALARLLMPDFLFTPASIYGLPPDPVAWLGSTQAQSVTTVPTVTTAAAADGMNFGDGIVGFWLLGVLVTTGTLLAQTWRFRQRFTAARPCTDSALLDLLEDCKEQAGVRTPVCLVVNEAISAPALYGFLRPRLLLPSELVRSLNRDELRCIFQHEIAHVRGGDIAVNWLVSLAIVFHWFNPFVWFMAIQIARARELACDRAVLVRQKDSRLYGEVILRVAETLVSPQTVAGMAGIIENKHAIHERIKMITQPYKKTGWVVTLGVALLLGALFLSDPLRANSTSDDAITASVKTAEAWLPIIDAGKYAESYDGFCVVAKTSLTQDAWVKASRQVRDPLGKLVSRTLKSKQYLTALPGGEQGQFVIVQYETAYANLNATETVTTMLDKDGQWRIAGYYIRPR